MNNKQELYNQAKEQYYNGNPIMGDAEFDELEKELGLENESFIGTKHSPNYTVKHPFIMGSLSKVQVHAGKDGTVDWDKVLNDVVSYCGRKQLIVTPKFDGCSFEAYIHNNTIDISTRGDGLWGRDIKSRIASKIPYELLHFNDEYTLRGEVLVSKDVFDEKFSNEFANTRSFVAGTLSNEDATREALDALEIVIYDYRHKDGDNWVDSDWTSLPPVPATSIYSIGNFDMTCADDIKSLYDIFDGYRKKCRYSLDGFVIKPCASIREQNFTKARPSDCVAVKFLPMTATTKIEKIEWSLGKTGEFTPVVYYAPVLMDGKTCIKASGHNYGWLVQKGCGIGAEVVISMAGDIIPYIYKINTTSEDIPLPEDSYDSDGHLMKHMTQEERIIENFRNNCLSLKINGLGDAQVSKMIEHLKEQIEPDPFFGETINMPFPSTIYELSPSRIEQLIGGKTGLNIAREYDRVLKDIPLETVIESMNFRMCGKKVSQAVAKYLITGDADFDSMATEGYLWAMDALSDKYSILMYVLDKIGKPLSSYKENVVIDDTPKTYVILTGDPSMYATKGEFMKAHPEYEETGSWKKVQIVFTGDMNSNTSKMRKAKEKNIEIRIY